VQAPELLGSSQCKALFDILLEHFTWIIIDSPPVLHVTDATVLARIATAVVMVVGSGMTSARAARRAIEELQAGGGTVLGAVLNRAKLDQHPFYFSPYSRSEYRTVATTKRAAPTLVGKSA
jgi:Mrp family chromosome partitioning ATPase